ncbi:hypothetical protein VIGAN_09165200, partial [Vigna angularis var. angularis]
LLTWRLLTIFSLASSATSPSHNPGPPQTTSCHRTASHKSSSSCHHSFSQSSSQTCISKNPIRSEKSFEP